MTVDVVQDPVSETTQSNFGEVEKPYCLTLGFQTSRWGGEECGVGEIPDALVRDVEFETKLPAAQSDSGTSEGGVLSLQFRLEASPVDTLLKLLLVFILDINCASMIMKSLTASKRLNKHLPRLDRS